MPGHMMFAKDSPAAKLPRLKVHRAWRQDCAGKQGLNDGAVNRSIEVIADRASILDNLREFHGVLQTHLHSTL